MTKRIALALAVVAALFALVTAPAGAQDGPAITVEPATVEAAGEQEFTITGTGWTVDSVFVLQCIPTDAPLELDAQGGDCDLGNLTPASNDGSGGFTVSVTYDVPEEGLSIIVTDTETTEGAYHLVTVGAAQEEGGEEAAEEGGEEAAEEEGGEEAAEEGGEEELANTGVESGLLAIMAAAVLAGGLMVLGATRRRTA